uniref:Reverse transcriptase domain, reverse transcriptase zinc-binding domain protein n=1 Tax=Tanacetum cinerariifolium TaxID=118510 RepID=A0A6L2NLZ7_TANCI|nr:reverse transcriptase domain, reverse transcriptase zinc-binding domain protein [Tanacetum cinerariifolium]
MSPTIPSHVTDSLAITTLHRAWLSMVPLLLEDIDDVILWRDLDGVLRPFSVACAWDTIRTRADIVWSKVCVFCGLDSIPPWLIDVISFITPISKGKTVVSILSRLVLTATSYYIWLERNGILFKKKTSSPDQIVDVIISMVQLKLVTFKFKKMSTRSRLLLDQWKIPSYRIIHDGSSKNPNSRSDSSVTTTRTSVVNDNTTNPRVSMVSTLDSELDGDVTSSAATVKSSMINETNIEALFGVKCISQNDIDAFSMNVKEGKYVEILSTLFSNEIDDVVDAIESIGKKLDNSNLNVTKQVVEPTQDDPIVRDVNINTNSTSYAGAAGASGASAKEQPKVSFNFRHFMNDPVFEGVNISIPRKVVEKVSLPLTGMISLRKRSVPRCDVCMIFGQVHDNCSTKMVSPLIVTTSSVDAPTVEVSNDGFQTVGKKKKRKGKSKFTNGGQFADPSLKQTVRYEPNATPSAPKKITTNVSNPIYISSMLKTIETFPKRDDFTTSNFYVTSQSI